MHVSAVDRHRQYRDQAIPLWPDQPPGGIDGAEFWTTDHDDPRFHGIQVPTLTWFPAPQAVSRAAVLVCPGGGMRKLPIDRQGWSIAEALNLAGIHAAVLSYRHSGSHADEPMPPRVERAVADVQRGLQVMQAGADQRDVDPQQIGVLSFSVGGVLTRLAIAKRLGASSASEHGSADSVADAISAEQPVIAHAGFIYPAGPDYLGLDPLTLPAEQPPSFVTGLRSDALLPAADALATQLNQADGTHAAQHEVHLFADGEHGHGVDTTGSTRLWLDLYVAWLLARTS